MWNQLSIPVPLIASFLLTASFGALAAGLSISDLPAGTSVKGSTVGLQSTIPLTLSTAGPQQLYWFRIPQTASGDAAQADIHLTTCPQKIYQDIQDAFDSSITLFENNIAVLLNGSTPSPVAVSAPDCGGKHGTLDFRMETNKQYLLVVSSTSGSSGRFVLTTTVVSAPPTPTPLPWGLDRIDQRSLPLDERYSVRGTSNADVYVYVLDSGVRISHEEFAYDDGTTNVFHGKDIVQGLNYSVDCVGHGTHVAGVIAGKSFGVAKKAKVISVRVLGCAGFGYTSNLIAGLQFVLDDVKTNNRRPAVVSMSLIAPDSSSVNSMVRQVFEQGIPVVTAAGNTDQDSCKFSPASEPTAITVAASNRDDTRPSFSNSGSCVDIFAPGENILSAWNTGDNNARTLTGTSSACPHVTGAAAVLLSANPNLPPGAVSAMVYSAATFSVISNESGTVSKGTTKKAEANNRLLYVRPVPYIHQELNPPKRYMYIYSILGILGGSTESTSCSTWLDSNVRTTSASEYLRRITWLQATQNSVVFKTCCPGTSQNPCGNAVNRSGILVRLMQNEALVSGAFDTLQSSLQTKSGLGNLRNAFKTDYIRVDVEPWVVDSDGNIFWTAPNLRGETFHLLGKAAKAGIIVGVLCVCIALLVLIVVLLRRRNENNRRNAFQAQVEKFRETKKDQVSVHNIRLGLVDETPTEELPRSNSALEGDVLVNLPSTASLRSPRPGGSTPDLQTPRASGGPERTWNKFSTRVLHQIASPWGRRRDSVTHGDASHESVNADRVPELPGRRQSNWFFSPRISSQGAGSDGIAATPRTSSGNASRIPPSPWGRRRNSPKRGDTTRDSVNADREQEAPGRRQNNWFMSPRISSQGAGTDGIAATPGASKENESSRPFTSRGLRPPSLPRQNETPHPARELTKDEDEPSAPGGTQSSA
jgi:subtilisin family serine protease